MIKVTLLGMSGSDSPPGPAVLRLVFDTLRPALLRLVFDTAALQRLCVTE